MSKSIFPPSGAHHPACEAVVLVPLDQWLTHFQQWIDDPASNNGLLMNNQIAANQFDVTFNSVENTNPPILTFQTQAVPDSSAHWRCSPVLSEPSLVFAAVEVPF